MNPSDTPNQQPTTGIDRFNQHLQRTEQFNVDLSMKNVADINLPDLNDLDVSLSGLSADSTTEDFNKVINWQGRDVKDVLGLTNVSNRLKLSQYSIKNDSSDVNDFMYIADQSPVLKTLIAKGNKMYLPFENLIIDVYMSLFKYNPEFTQEGMMAPEAIYNRMMVKEIINLPKWRTLRNNCKLNELNSAMGVDVLSPTILDLVSKMVNHLREKFQLDQQNQVAGQNPMDAIQQANQINNRQNQLMDQLQGIQSIAQTQMQNGQQVSEKLVQIAANIENELQSIDNQLVEVNKGLNAYKKEASDAFKKNLAEMKVAMDEAKAEISEIKDTLTGWGFGDGDPMLRVSIEGKRRAIEQIRRSDKLKEIAEILGRLRKIANFEQKKKSKDGKLAIRSVETGNDLSSTLPSEKMLLAHDTAKNNFYVKMSERQLLQYHRDSTSIKARGPLIICCDVSGSMRGTREPWAKAIIVALMEIAQKQKRDFASILFNSNIADITIIEKNYLNPEDIVRVAELMPGGGTNFEKPMEEALKLIEDSRFKKADIVFITDGESDFNKRMTEKVKKAKAEKDFFVQGILINSGGDVTDSTLKKFCDDITSLSDVMSSKADDVVHKIFGTV